MKKTVFISLLFFCATAASADNYVDQINSGSKNPIDDVTASSSAFLQNNLKKTTPLYHSEFSDEADWELIKVLEGVEFYQKRIKCRKSENIILKILNKSEKQTSCEVRFTPVLPVVPEFHEVHDIKAGGELEGFCSAKYLTFPGLGKEEFKLEFSVTVN